jgi:hypothetical protein
MRLLEKWKDMLNARHTVAKFTDPQHLAVQVAADLARTVQALEEAAQDRSQDVARSGVKTLDEVQILISEALQKGIAHDLILSVVRRSIADVLASTGDRKPRIFLSYAEDDRNIVRGLREGLQAQGIDVLSGEPWLSPHDSPSTLIERGLDSADFVAFFLSRAWVGSQWVRRELNVAMSRQLSANRGAILLPVLLDDAEIPALLRDVMYLDMRNADVRAGVNMLIAAMRRHQLERLKPTERSGYADVGVEIPVDIATLDDSRLFRFISEVLEPEAWIRASRDYESVEVREPQKAIRRDADAKLEQLARLHGFLPAWHRYLATKGRAIESDSA